MDNDTEQSEFNRASLDSGVKLQKYYFRSTRLKPAELLTPGVISGISHHPLLSLIPTGRVFYDP